MLLEALTRLEHGQDQHQQREQRPPPMGHSMEPLQESTTRQRTTHHYDWHSTERTQTIAAAQSWHQPTSEPISDQPLQDHVQQQQQANKSSQYRTVHYRVQWDAWRKVQQLSSEQHGPEDSGNQQLGSTSVDTKQTIHQKTFVLPKAKSDERSQKPFDTRQADSGRVRQVGLFHSSSESQLYSNRLVRVQPEEQPRGRQPRSASSWWSSSGGEWASDTRRESDPLQPGSATTSSQLMGSQAASLLLIDVHHQLALLYTLTNRTAEVSTMG